ncbi:MAG: right-handed parallel beta-helix repeat-containing protein, partial [Candidatus Poseidoniales archaeon]
SKGNITHNQILGVCKDDDCATVYFTKVAENGIKIESYSDIVLIENEISSFNFLVNISKSDILINNNYLNFGNTGIYLIEGNSAVISSNNISNGTTLIEVFDSVEIEIVSNSFSNFGHAFLSTNSTSQIYTNQYLDGETCLELIDSSYTISNYDNFDCNEAYLYEKFNVNVNILTDDGIASPNHQFYFYNEFDDSKEYSQTKTDGISNYLLLKTLKIDNAGLNINFNNYYFGFYHNNILSEIELEVNKNVTIMAYLDTSAPSTTLATDSYLINTEAITLQFSKTSEKDDLLSFDLYVLENDGENFAQWEYVNTYNQSLVSYQGEDGTKYRFKAISRDIYGNIEAKESYDCEIQIDIQTPNSFFEDISENYYFTGSESVLLNWNSLEEDINSFEIKIFYNNDVTPYIGDNSDGWVAENTLYYYEKDSLVYILENIGHYGFMLTAKDFAGNEESKTSFDFIVNYDPDSDRLTFDQLPKKWGEETLAINIDSSNLFLDFSLFIAMESVDNTANTMTWYEHSEQEDSSSLLLEGLLDRTKYYIYAESVDLAGNIEDPLNSTEIFASDGAYNQKHVINYIPLAHGDYDFVVTVDNDFDRVYETELNRGYNLNNLESNEFYLDVSNKTLIFGGITNGGFVPNEDLDKLGNIKVKYSGVHAIIEVYTGDPLPAQSINIIPTNITNIIFEYEVPNDSETCKVQITTNVSKGWFNEEIIEPCFKGSYIFELTDPQLEKEYFFRIMIENEFGLTSYSESESIKMDDVAKLYSTNSETTDDGLLGMDSIIPVTALIGIVMLSFGGVLLYRSKNNDMINENVSIIESKPVAKYKVEELYLIFKDGRLIKNISAVEVKTDSDIMSGMLTAINDFVQDSFNTEGDLGSIDYGNNKIILQREKHSYLAAVVYGEIDNYFKGKLINAVRKIEEENKNIGNWSGDSSSITNVQKNLEPIIAETESATREMVDNYFTEKEIAITTTYDRNSDNTTLKINLSNYSSTNITDCKIIPEYNNSLLGLNGIIPTVPYYFDKNTFEIGDIKSYNEVQFTLKMKNKSNDVTTIELKLEYNHKGRVSSTSSNIEIT